MEGPRKAEHGHKAERKGKELGPRSEMDGQAEIGLGGRQ